MNVGTALAKLGVVIVLVVATAIIGLAFTAPPQHEFSESQVNIINTTDEPVVVIYNITFEQRGKMDIADRKLAMDSMNDAGRCAHEQLSTYANNHTKHEVRNANLREVVIDCQTDNITIEAFTYGPVQ